MRDFFKSELQTLKIKTGLNQYENLSALPDAGQQLQLLFDTLVKVCDEFPYIPDNDKKRIIQEQILRDNDFTQLTPRVVWKWLNAEKGKYFREAAHIPITPTAKPVTYDELSTETKEAFNKLLNLLQDGNIRQVPMVSQDEIDYIKQRDTESREGRKAISTNYKPKDELVEHLELRTQWMRECTDIYTGKLKEGAPTFEQWAKTKEL